MESFTRNQFLNYQHLSCAAGFTFIELLVAIFIFSVGLLSLTQLQLNSLRLSHTTHQRITVINQLINLAERLQQVSTTSHAEFEIAEWSNAHPTLIFESSSQCSQENSLCQLTLRWKDAYKFNEVSWDIVM